MRRYSTLFKYTILVLVTTIGLSRKVAAQHDFTRDPMTISAGEGNSSGPSGRDNLGDNKGDNQLDKKKTPNPPQETELQKRDRQVREMVERKMQWRTRDQILQGLLIGEKAQREQFAKDAELELIERDRIQHERDMQEAERIRQAKEQERERVRKEIERKRNEGPINEGGGGGRG